MQTVRHTLAIVLALWLATPPVGAQPLTAAPPASEQAAIDRALAERAAAAEADRAAIRRVLDRSEVKEVASRMGLDIAQIQALVGTLDSTHLAQAADQARAVDQGLAGGATVVVTTTTIIIVLLLIILIVVIAN
jgi:2-hydroxychromene-2-carboxylate isomerase